MAMTHVDAGGGRLLQVVDAGDPDGVLVIVHHGTPSGAVLDPEWVSDAGPRGLRLVTYARPGYGTSTRQPGRVAADAAADAAVVADHFRADRFLTWGFSGGGPHALACAALLPDRVVAAASLASIGPYDAKGLDFTAGMGQGNVEEFGLVVSGGEAAVRPLAEAQAAEIATAGVDELIASMAPFLSELDATTLRGPIGTTLLASMQDGLRSGVDGWVDDDLVFARPWSFRVEDIAVPVLLWQGRQDAMVPFGHGEWLAAHIPGVDARLSERDGHLTLVTDRLPEVHAWLRDRWDAAG